MNNLNYLPAGPGTHGKGHNPWWKIVGVMGELERVIRLKKQARAGAWRALSLWLNPKASGEPWSCFKQENDRSTFVN